MAVSLINLAYLFSTILFIYGLKGLTHPRTAVRGNLMGALGMLIAIVATLFNAKIASYEIIIAGLVVGSAIGTLLAARIRMTAIPQIIALLNGFGGGASFLVAGAVLYESIYLNENFSLQFRISIAASGVIGAVTLLGSLIAFAKLQELISEKAINFKGHNIINAILFLIILSFCGLSVYKPEETIFYWIIVALSSILGILSTIPIGGADMPVVISLLNSYSGLAAVATGFVLNNNSLIISGSLVGSSGLILTQIMCIAMNRSLAHVLFGIGSTTEKMTTKDDDIYAGRVKSVTPEEVAMLFDVARRVVIVPGYGMAISQAQYAVRDLFLLLEKNGMTVEFGIHPVAGRMPGHMNVLLAEVNIPYEKLKTMEEINTTFEQTDIVIVIGANDVVNPIARTNTKSPIAGMPILNVDKAKTVVIIKRGLSPGFAGIPNPLFAADNTLMLFSDGKKAVLDIISAVKAA
ncbi:MAG TPA: NAD(P)(+) transhydrogenase (Re/Si-specific) subunit beta [bacterium]